MKNPVALKNPQEIFKNIFPSPDKKEVEECNKVYQPSHPNYKSIPSSTNTDNENLYLLYK